MSLKKVFYSHAWSDKALVRPYKKALDNYGINGFMDDEGGIRFGDGVFGAIAEGIEKSDIILMFVSPSYLNRPNCNREVQLSVSWDKIFIPVSVPPSPHSHTHTHFPKTTPPTAILKLTHAPPHTHPRLCCLASPRRRMAASAGHQ